jgi:hypothetical protein
MLAPAVRERGSWQRRCIGDGQQLVNLGVALLLTHAPAFTLSPPSHPHRAQDAETRGLMFNLGRAEALSWAQEAGFAAAKAKTFYPVQ